MNDSQLGPDSKLLYLMKPGDKKGLFAAVLRDTGIQYTKLRNYIKKRSDIGNLTAMKDIIDIKNDRGTEKHIAKVIKGLVDGIDFVPTKYLDIGCADGKKTSNISAIFKLDKKTAYGLDRKSWEGIEYEQDASITNATIDSYDSDVLPYDDNTFDTITILQVLHHIQNLHKMMYEINRILKKDGIVIIREHDADSMYMKGIIDIEHMIFAALYDNTDLSTFVNSYYASYKSLIAWDALFKGMGYTKMLSTEPHGASRRYYAIYKKI